MEGQSRHHSFDIFNLNLIETFSTPRLDPLNLPNPRIIMLKYINGGWIILHPSHSHATLHWRRHSIAIKLLSLADPSLASALIPSKPTRREHRLLPVCFESWLIQLVYSNCNCCRRSLSTEYQWHVTHLSGKPIKSKATLILGVTIESEHNGIARLFPISPVHKPTGSRF